MFNDVTVVLLLLLFLHLQCCLHRFVFFSFPFLLLLLTWTECRSFWKNTKAHSCWRKKCPKTRPRLQGLVEDSSVAQYQLSTKTEGGKNEMCNFILPRNRIRVKARNTLSNFQGNPFFWCTSWSSWNKELRWKMMALLPFFFFVHSRLGLRFYFLMEFTCLCFEDIEDPWDWQHVWHSVRDEWICFRSYFYYRLPSFIYSYTHVLQTEILPVLRIELHWCPWIPVNNGTFSLQRQIKETKESLGKQGARILINVINTMEQFLWYWWRVVMTGTDEGYWWQGYW